MNGPEPCPALTERCCPTMIRTQSCVVGDGVSSWLNRSLHAHGPDHRHSAILEAGTTAFAAFCMPTVEVNSSRVVELDEVFPC